MLIYQTEYVFLPDIADYIKTYVDKEKNIMYINKNYKGNDKTTIVRAKDIVINDLLVA